MSGEHWNFILAAYAVAAAVLVGLTAWIWFDLRRQRTLLADLEARGVPRRPPAGSTGAAEAARSRSVEA